mgnify:FL=1
MTTSCTTVRLTIDSSQMAETIDLVELRAKGVARASFHPDGSLASVEFFGPEASMDAPQHEARTPAATRPMSAGRSRLVPRVVHSDQ